MTLSRFAVWRFLRFQIGYSGLLLLSFQWWWTEHHFSAVLALLYETLAQLGVNSNLRVSSALLFLWLLECFMSFRDNFSEVPVFFLHKFKLTICNAALLLLINIFLNIFQFLQILAIRNKLCCFNSWLFFLI